MFFGPNALFQISLALLTMIQDRLLSVDESEHIGQLISNNITDPALLFEVSTFFILQVQDKHVL